MLRGPGRYGAEAGRRGRLTPGGRVSLGGVNWYGGGGGGKKKCGEGGGQE